MSREPDASTAALAAAATSKITRLASAPRLESSASKYRISHSNSNLPDDATPAPAASAMNTRLSAPNVTTFVSLMKRSSSTRPKGAQLSPSSSHQPPIATSEFGGAPGDDEREYASQQTGKAMTLAEGKLPHKLRHHISRLRIQGAPSTVTPQASSPTSTLSKQRNGSPPPPRPSLGSRPSRNGKCTSIVVATSTTPQYSRQSQKIQLLHEVMRMQAVTAAASESTSQSRRSSVPLDGEVETESFLFLDLLRPLQNSLSCATLISEWPSDDEDDDLTLETEEAQSERDRSRMLRICCSIDNLLLSIGDQVQKEKLDTEIVRGAARKLVQLFQFAVKQVASAAFGGTNRGGADDVGLLGAGLSPQRWEKEAQYASEFLEEVAERFGKLDAFVRATLLGEIRGLQDQITELQAECEGAKRLNAQLQTEMADLRDFHSQNGIASLTLHGPDQVSETDDDSLGLQLAVNSNQCENGSSESELEMLKKQCDEYARLLEMAKQEIRLSHHERDVHKAHVAELSSALFKDSELRTLRNQLQSEKKRVKILEMENVALLECQYDQALKIQSLLANKSPPTTTAATTATVPHANYSNIKAPVVAGNGILDSSAATDAIASGDRSIALSIDMSGASNSAAAAEADIATAHNAPVTSGVKDGGSAYWFSRLISSMSRLNTSDADATRASKLCKMVATLPQSVWEQAQTRRQTNVPTIPPSSLGLQSTPSDNARPQSGSKKRKLKSATNSEVVPSVISKTELEHSCRCLIWFFFQRFLMAQEAGMLLENPLLDGCAVGGAMSCMPTTAGSGTRASLEFVVYHFFLERAPSDNDAITDLTDFVQCLQLCRNGSFQVELFCSFLDGQRSHDDLCFLLWVLQAINDTEVGISYNEHSLPPAPLATGNNKQPGYEGEREPQFICLLKAMFVTRATFRLLRFKSASALAGSTPTTSGNRKARPSTAPSRSASASSLVKPLSPLSPMRRKMKSRTGDELLGERSKSQLKLTGAEASSESAADQATTALRNAIEANSGRPVTLEVFNQLLAQFAVAPSAGELASLLGPFYHSTGDERKLPWEVFIALLLEMYRHQSKWQREQLRSLFMHLHWQAEMDERSAAKKKAEELALLAAATKKRAGAQGNNPSATQGERKMKKKKPKKRTLVQSGLESSGEPGAKYLRGLTRPILSDLLRTSGIIEDLGHVDIDWLFVRILDVANMSSMDIHFDDVYDAFWKLRLLPDWSRGLQTVLHSERFQNCKLEEFAPALQVQWRELSSTSLALCENDPNVFVRKQSQQWIQRIDSSIIRLSKLPLDMGGPTPWHVIESICAVLSYAWSLASKRSRDTYLRSERATTCATLGTCFTEFYFADRTVRATVDSFAGFGDPAAVVSTSLREANGIPGSSLHGSLECFYNTSMMRLEPSIAGLLTTDVSNQQPRPTEAVLQVQIEHVLQRYAVHFAYLYARHKTAAFNYSSGVALHQWRQMAYKLSLIHPNYLSPSRLQQLFFQVVTPTTGEQASWSPATLEVDDLALNPTQFVELFVVVAFELYRRVTTRHRKRCLLRGPNALSLSTSKRNGPQIDTIWRPLLSETDDRGGHRHNPAQVLALFLHELVTRMAIHHRTTPHEVSFSQKLCCPLVGRALLEHRAFLRSVFFYYAKQDEEAADMQAAAQLSVTPQRDGQAKQVASTSSGSGGSELEPKSDNGSQANSRFQFQLEKTKRNSMSFDEFQMFLGEFALMHEPSAVPPPGIDVRSGSQPILTLEDARRVFQSVMSVDNDDVSQLEFDEFAGAIVALAVFFSPDPFTLWHEKIHAFVSNLKSWMREDDVRLQY